MDPETTSTQQEQQPDSAAAPTAAEQDAPSAAGDEQEQAASDGRSFTQADLDRIVKDRLARAEAKWKAEAENAAKLAKMDEAERVKHEAEQAVAAKDALVANLRARLVAAEAKAAASAAGVKPERLDYAIKLADLDAAVNEDGEVDRGVVTEAIAAVVAAVPELAAQGPVTPGRSGGDFNADNSADGKRVWKTSEVTALASNPAEYRQHEADIMAAVREGRIVRDT